MIDRIQEQCKLTLPAFRNRVLPIEWMPRGILTSEGLAFCAMGDLYHINAVFESGVAEGRSTEMWAKHWPRTQILASDLKWPSPQRRKVLQDLGVHLFQQDTTRIMCASLASRKHSRIGVFIDGPKGEAAVKLAVECMAFDCVKFVGVHDLSQKLNRTERQLFDAVPLLKWYTDEGWFVDNYGHLDHDDSHWDEEQGTKWTPYTRHEKDKPSIDRGSYGYTIGFLCKDLSC
jgi:hypothetical protein